MRDEIIRRDVSSLRVAPTDQGLAADHLAARGIDLWLIVKFEFICGNGLAQLA
jgi:hypothetical protein